jgi:NADPH:quinone reductase-like Zn-dependent oxidoreductase
MDSERHGGYAEYVTAWTDRVHDATDSPLTNAQLAAQTAYGTALGMIERGRLRKGETALISRASGGVGLAAVQIARARGAKVLAISSGPKIDCGAQGQRAHEVLDHVQDIAEQIRSAAPEGVVRRLYLHDAQVDGSAMQTRALPPAHLPGSPSRDPTRHRCDVPLAPGCLGLVVKVDLVPT